MGAWSRFAQAGVGGNGKRTPAPAVVPAMTAGLAALASADNRLRHAANLARERLTIHEAQAQVLPTARGIPWLGFVVYPTHRLLKRRNAVNFTRRLEANLEAYAAAEISFAELDASVKGWVNHVRYADSWGLREHVFGTHPLPMRAG